MFESARSAYTRAGVVPRVLVLGLGNVLFQDEGLGVRAVERLIERYRLPPGISALDGGTLGLGLLPHVAETDWLLAVDAVRTGAPPGSLVRLEDQAVPAQLALKVSLHQIGFQELLAASRLHGTQPDHLVLWGMEPAVLDWGVGLSVEVEAALDGLVAAVANELRGWGFQLRQRNGIAENL